MGPSSHYVRSLGLAQDQYKWITPRSLANIANLTSFCNVQFLSLNGLDLTHFDEYSLARFFGHFSKRLTSLSAEGLTVHPDALLFFLCMFPNLDNLKLDYLTTGKATIPFRIPTITPRFRGKLALSNIKSNGTSIVTLFMHLPMAFEDVCVENCRFETPRPLKDLFVACQETMRKVRVCKIFFGAFRFRDPSNRYHVFWTLTFFSIPDDISQTPLVDLSPCKGIEEMELSLIQLRYPSHWIEPILQTVTSTRVRKITFDADHPTIAEDIDYGIDLHTWSELDQRFLEMAKALGPDGGLELVFNALVKNPYGESNPVDPGRFLEECRTKAVVRFECAKTHTYWYEPHALGNLCFPLSCFSAEQADTNTPIGEKLFPEIPKFVVSQSRSIKHTTAREGAGETSMNYVCHRSSLVQRFCYPTS